MRPVARLVTVLIVTLALLGNAGCFASCVLPQSEPAPGSCHHHDPVKTQCSHQHVISSPSGKTALVHAVPQHTEFAGNTRTEYVPGGQYALPEIVAERPPGLSHAHKPVLRI